MPPVTLPATVMLHRWRSVYDLDAGTRMIGLDPRAALVVGNLVPALADLVADLRIPVAPDEFAARAVARGVPAPAAHALLHALYEAGELVDGSAPGRVAAHRAAAVVAVHGSGPLTSGIVVGLAASGIGTLHLVATGEVTGADLGTGLVGDDRGRKRLEAIPAAAARAVPGTAVTPWPRNLVPDLVVLADEYPDPLHSADLVTTGIPHLPVRLRDGIGVVGPLVLPGRTACLGCLDLQRSACDSNWPRVAAQLAGRRGGGDPACVQATVGLAVAQTVGAVDATAGGVPAPPTLEASLELDVGTATITRRPWQAVPGCPCRAADTRAADLTRTEFRRGATIEG